MEIILLCLYGKVTVIVIFLIIYLYWIWKKVRLIKWEQAPGDTRDWIRNHEKNINKIIKIISGIGLIFMVYCIVIPAIVRYSDVSQARVYSYRRNSRVLEL